MAANNSKAEARRAEARRAEAKLEAKPVDIESQRLKLKNLIVLGKERGFLTYAEINDSLPDDIVDAEVKEVKKG